MPFYRQLVEAERSHRGAAALSVISIEPPEVVKQFLSKQQVAISQAYRISRVEGLVGTPTLLFVDDTGVVRRLFAGKLDPAQEEAALKIVQNGKV